MNVLILMAEKAFRGARVVSKVSYYRLKYGKQLKIGKRVHFRKGFIINISRDGKVEIGDGTFFNNYCSINCRDEIIIGKGNLFGEGVKVYDHNHVFNNKKLEIEKNYKTHPVIIGDKNWFGSNVTILSKAKVGNNNVFGANIVVNSEYGSNKIVKQSEKIDEKEINYR